MLKQPRSRRSRLFAGGMILLAAVIATTFLLHLPTFQASAAPAGPDLTVNAATGRHAISPDIYGVNTYGIDPAFAQELHFPVQRWGGDATSRYNWQTDSSNAGFDWYFMGGSGSPTAPSAGADAFIKKSTSTGGKALLTIPLLDYIDKGGSYNCSFPVSLYGKQQSVNPYVHPNGTDCGNSLSPDGKTQLVDKNIALNNIPNSPAYQQQWLQYLTKTFGTAAHGGVNIYQMDNEPSGWGNTHRDIHPSATGYDELVNKTYAYASMVKSVDPSANVLGPSDFGWAAYVGSSKAGDNGATHNNTWFAEYYLQMMHQYELQHHVRLLNYFDEHFYPNTANQPAGDANTQAIRLRSTRSLWDPTYKEENWIGQWYPPIQLIRTFHTWVNKDYPGTKIAMTEYNWGGVESLNGALAEADVLGIFGREQLDLATMWGPPTAQQPAANAFRMYLNYDGKGSKYGNTWVSSSSADQGKLAIYGAQRSSDGALTLMVINKTGGDLTSKLALSGFSSASAAQVYTYSGANLKSIVRQANQTTSTSGFSRVYPANSITLLVIPSAGHILTAPKPVATSTLPGGAKATATPATPKVTATAPTSSADSHFQLIFSDDFNGSTLNPQWIAYGGPHGGGKSYYDPHELILQNGILHIQMEQKTTNGLPYTTGGMGAMRLAQTYGKYEFRAKLPHGKGVGPYAILWPSASGHGDVEVDLFESPPANKDKVYFTNHGNGSPTQIIAPGNFADAYHVFTYEWTPGKLHFLIDGVDQGTLTKNVPNFPMWFGIAVSSGDAFTGLPDATTTLPVSLDVDWVHIYKYTG